MFLFVSEREEENRNTANIPGSWLDFELVWSRGCDSARVLLYYFLSLSTQYSMKVLELYVVFSLLGRCSQFPSEAASAGSQSVSSWWRGVLVRLSPSRPCTWLDSPPSRCPRQGIPDVPRQTWWELTGWLGWAQYWRKTAPLFRAQLSGTIDQGKLKNILLQITPLLPPWWGDVRTGVGRGLEDHRTSMYYSEELDLPCHWLIMFSGLICPSKN